MCQELYRRWEHCPCWGFLRPQTCPHLFKGCFGPRGPIDKIVIEVVPGACRECQDRWAQEQREAEAEAEAMAAASATSPSQSTSSSGGGSRVGGEYGQKSRARHNDHGHRETKRRRH